MCQLDIPERPMLLDLPNMCKDPAAWGNSTQQVFPVLHYNGRMPAHDTMFGTGRKTFGSMAICPSEFRRLICSPGGVERQLGGKERSQCPHALDLQSESTRPPSPDLWLNLWAVWKTSSFNSRGLQVGLETSWLSATNSAASHCFEKAKQLLRFWEVNMVTYADGWVL